MEVFSEKSPLLLVTMLETKIFKKFKLFKTIIVWGINLRKIKKDLCQLVLVVTHLWDLKANIPKVQRNWYKLLATELEISHV